MLANVSNMCRVLELKPIINEIKRNHDKQIDDEKNKQTKTYLSFDPPWFYD